MTGQERQRAVSSMQGEWKKVCDVDRLGIGNSNTMGFIAIARRPPGITFVRKATASRLSWGHRQWEGSLSPSDELLIGRL